MDLKKGEPRRLFVRRDGVVKGPYPAGQVSRYILLGRIVESDEISSDKTHWKRVGDTPELIPEAMRNVATEEDRRRLELARMREDERLNPDRRRRTAGDDGPDRERRRGDRRRAETTAAISHRAAQAEVLLQGRQAARKNLVLPTMLLALVAAAFIAAFLAYRPAAAPESDRDCGAPAAPRINWSYCHMEGKLIGAADLVEADLSNAMLVGANLQGARLVRSKLSYANLGNADLSHADLRQADLAGAALHNANLSGSNLAGANLSYANLRGADLAGAKLARTILERAYWVDGRVCAVGSIGACK